MLRPPFFWLLIETLNVSIKPPIKLLPVDCILDGFFFCFDNRRDKFYDTMAFILLYSSNNLSRVK